MMANCSTAANYSIFTESRTFVVISGTALGLASVLCLAAVALVVAANLHKNLVYRLSLYQVFSSLTFTALWVTYLAVRDVNIFVRNVFAVLSGCSVLVTLLVTTWIVVHLFALAVFNKNLRKLEPLYVASAILVALGAAGVIFATLVLFDKTDGELCPDIRAVDIEWFAGYCAGYLILIVDCLLVSVMGVTLCFRAFKRTERVFTQPDPKDKKILFEMVPLLVYPVMLLITLSPILIGLTIKRSVNYVFVIFTSSLSIVTALTLIAHVGIVLWNKKQVAARDEKFLSTASSTPLGDCASLIERSPGSNIGEGSHLVSVKD